MSAEERKESKAVEGRWGERRKRKGCVWGVGWGETDREPGEWKRSVERRPLRDRNKEDIAA